ncbi:MAG: SDR family NAD(P)-dependent oxidoreductase, partial [Planctomycetaceae bacterium]|nr:SDR family NAD(P)-dependent oxidoreductase [Planctomycetaceae bacterium]
MRIEPDMKVLVTGAASGIGREIVRRLARFEVEFLLVDRDPAGLANLAAELEKQNLRATTHTCDLADAAQIDALAVLVQQKWGGLQILINNAGVAWYG